MERLRKLFIRSVIVMCLALIFTLSVYNARAAMPTSNRVDAPKSSDTEKVKQKTDNPKRDVRA